MYIVHHKQNIELLPHRETDAYTSIAAGRKNLPLVGRTANIVANKYAREREKVAAVA